jgi:hypothetical protein
VRTQVGCHKRRSDAHVVVNDDDKRSPRAHDGVMPSRRWSGVRLRQHKQLVRKRERRKRRRNGSRRPVVDDHDFESRGRQGLFSQLA